MANISIYIDGEPLDMAKSGISVTFTPLRFCGGVMSDGVSVDFTLPPTRRNMELLGMGGELYGGFPDDIRGLAVCGAFTRECRVSVKSVTAEGITAAVFLFAVPAGMADRLLWRLLPDDSFTIVPWYASLDDEYTFPSYAAESGNALGCYARHPFLSWGGELKAAIEQACGCTIDDTAAAAVFSDFYDLGILADGKRLCPENPTQCLYVALRTGESYGYIYGGQHAVNDLESGGLFSWYRDQLGLFPESWQWDGSGVRAASEQRQTGATAITFNRDCEARITVRAIGSGVRTLEINGSPVALSVSTSIGGNYYEAVTNEQFAAGDTLAFVPMSANDDLLIKIDYTDYMIEEADYDRPLAYMPVDMSFTVGTDPLEPSWTGWSYSYFGLWANAPKRAVRSLMTTLAWAVGCELKVSGSEIAFTTTTLTEAVNVRQRLVTAVNNGAAMLNGKGLIKWRNEPFMRTIGEGEGEEETTVFESEFQSPEVSDRRLTGVGLRTVVPIYDVQYSDGDQRDWPVQYTDMEGVFGLRVQVAIDPFEAELQPFGELSDMGLEAVGTGGIVEVEGVTTDDISAADTLNCEGVALLVEEAVYNSDNENFNYKAIRI